MSRNIPVCLILFLAGCSDLRESGIIDSQACFLCHTVPPGETEGHYFGFEKTHYFECNICHQGYSEDSLLVNEILHYNGNKDVVPDTTYFLNRFGKYPAMAYKEGTCSNIPCHGYGLEGRYNTTWNEDSTLFMTWNSASSYTVWNTSASIGDTLDCNGCHNTAEHICYTKAYQFECYVCHIGYNQDSLLVNDRLHYNGHKDVVLDTIYFIWWMWFRQPPSMRYEEASCSNIPCHGYGMQGRDGTTRNEDSTFITWNSASSYTVWNSNASVGDTLGCQDCHNTTQHKQGKICTNCHSEVSVDGINIIDYSLHINGKIEKDLLSQLK